MHFRFFISSSNCLKHTFLGINLNQHKGSTALFVFPLFATNPKLVELINDIESLLTQQQNVQLRGPHREADGSN